VRLGVRGLGKKLSFWTCSGRLIEESPLDSRFRGNDKQGEMRMK